jgi:Pentapeptide repeats (8 copies)
MKPSQVWTGLTTLIVGIAVGATASWALLFGALDSAKPLVESLLNSFLPLLGIACLMLVVIVPLVALAIHRFLKGAKGTLEQVIQEVSASAQAVAQKDVSTSVARAERAVLAALAWYAPVATRRWIVRTALGLLVAFGGLVGTALLFRQTVLLGEQNRKLIEQIDLLKDQNIKLDLQTVTAEAQRRAGLAPELFSILQEGSKQLKGKASPESPVALTEELAARIVAFSRSANPYWTIELDGRRVPRLADRARSPERGQLLTGLVLIGADLRPLVKKGAQFVASDLREANLKGAKLNYIDLQEADLRGADISSADLRDARFVNADLSCSADNPSKCSDLALAQLEAANFSQANLTGARLAQARVGCRTDGPDMTTGLRTLYYCTDFKDARLENAMLFGISISNVEYWSRIWPSGLPKQWKVDGATIRKSQPD